MLLALVMGRIGKLASRPLFHESGDRQTPSRRGDHAFECLPGVFDEARSKQEILGGIPGDRQFRERKKITAQHFGLHHHGAHARRVAGKVTDDRIDLGEADS